MIINEKEEKTAEQAYKEILDVVKKHRDTCVYNVNEMESLAKRHLFGIELKEKYGFNIEPRTITNLDWNSFGDHMALSFFGKKHRRSISYSDDGKSPEDELLLMLRFPTGWYIFGDDCPQELFDEFFQELKGYNPKYADTLNSALYFSMENAGKIFNEFSEIFKKYYELNKIDAKERKIKKLKAEIDKLQLNT